MLALIAQAIVPLPPGLLFPVSMGRLREARMASQAVHDLESKRWFLDVEIGGRIGLFRLTGLSLQLDAEAAVLARLDLEHNRDLLSGDFLGGFVFSYAQKDFALKLEYRHVSSHLIDEYFGQVPEARSNKYSRDAVILGGTAPFLDVLRAYFEVGYGFVVRGAARPKHVAAGIELSPAEAKLLPFAALHFELSDDSGLRPQGIAMAGAQWRFEERDRRARVGFVGSLGPSRQLQFLPARETNIGLGVWFDF